MPPQVNGAFPTSPTPQGNLTVAGTNLAWGIRGTGSPEVWSSLDELVYRVTGATGATGAQGDTGATGARACMDGFMEAFNREDLQALLRPLFITSWLIDDFLAEHHFFGIHQGGEGSARGVVLLSSAAVFAAMPGALPSPTTSPSCCPSSADALRGFCPVTRSVVDGGTTGGRFFSMSSVVGITCSPPVSMHTSDSRSPGSPSVCATPPFSAPASGEWSRWWWVIRIASRSVNVTPYPAFVPFQPRRHDRLGDLPRGGEEREEGVHVRRSRGWRAARAGRPNTRPARRTRNTAARHPGRS